MTCNFSSHNQKVELFNIFTIPNLEKKLGLSWELNSQTFIAEHSHVIYNLLFIMTASRFRTM